VRDLRCGGPAAGAGCRRRELDLQGGEWPARIDRLAGKVTMRYGLGTGASRSAPVTPLRAAGRGEHWWPVALAIIAVAGLHVILPAKYRANPPWWARPSCLRCWPR
jgi:hypothetical protein